MTWATGTRIALALAAVAVVAGGAVSCARRPPPEPLPFKAGDLVYYVPVDSKVVALTYDDGPNEPYTSALLDVLKENGAKATFFLIGTNAEVRPAVAQRILSEGHGIGNHSYTHPNFADIAPSRVVEEIESGESAIRKATGLKPDLFRAPFGSNTPDLPRFCQERGYLMVGWSFDGNDWNFRSASEIAGKVIGHLHPGAIILLHDGKETVHGADRRPSVEATKLILKELKAQGYRTVTVRELIQRYAYSDREIEFPGGIRFLGMRLTPPALRAGQALYAGYYWYFPAAAQPEGLAVFVHFNGTRGTLLQDDHPIDTFMATRDRVVIIPASARAGTYPVSVGLYQPAGPEKGRRLEPWTGLPVRRSAVRTPFELRVLGK